MLSLWSAKGGSGVTTVAIGVAAQRAAAGNQVLLVDVSGDLPAALGLAEPSIGLTEWLSAGAEPAALRRLEVATAAPEVRLLPLGQGSAAVDHDRRTALVAALAADRRTVVVDTGTIGAGGAQADLRHALIADADRSLLVTRACYLALRRLARHDIAPDGVIVVREHGRALDVDDVERLTGAPVVAQVDLDPAIARLVDAGLLVRRAPRGFTKPLGKVA